MEGPWTRHEASASGQVFEDRVWALLNEQSRGHLHVFRPCWIAGSSDRLIEKFGVPLGLPAPAITEEPPRLRGSPLGFLGESEVVRRLAEAAHLNLFRPFPDSETVELAVRHLKNGHVVGVQIKAVSVEAVHPNRPVDLYTSSFRPAATTFFTVVAWMPHEHRFHQECLVFPSEELLQFARPAGLHYKFEFQPGSTMQPRLNKYRRHLSDLCAEIDSLL